MQAIIDSVAGQTVASVLHTLGAIGMLAALVGYVGWERSLRRGDDHPNWLVLAGFSMYVAIFGNLVGGFMRTFQTGHPGLDQIGEEPWVLIMLVKHLVLFAGMAAALFLIHAVAPRLRRAQNTDRRPVDHLLGVGVVAASIVIATVMGALVQVTPIYALVEPEPEPQLQDTYVNLTGQLTSTPAAPRTATGTFEVPEGATTLSAQMAWDREEFDLALVLTGPDAKHEGTSATGTATVSAPAIPGTWTYVIRSDLAVDVSWTLSIHIQSSGANQTLLMDTVEILPNTFFEINTEMPLGATFHWDWDATADVVFDVHSHFDGEVQYHLELTASSHEGSFTNEREGGYSLLWENTNPTPVTLSYTVHGEFTVDSYFPPR